MSLQLIAPRVQPPLDENFRPAILANQHFRQEATPLDVRLILGLERSGGEISRFETRVLSPIDPNFGDNFSYIERIVKFLLWQRGGHTLYVGNSPRVAEYLREVYSANGARKNLA